MGITFADLAKETGLSTATISRVLSGKECVDPHTKELVLNATKKFNYVYRRRARSVTSTNMVLVLAGQLSNPVTVAYAEGIRQTLTPKGFNVLLSVTDYSETEDIRFLDYAKNVRSDGVFFLNVVETHELGERIKNMDCPVIFVNRMLRSFNADSVTVDNFRCGYIAVEYLIKKGHQRIAHLAGPKESLTCRQRNEGFCGAMKEYGLQITENSIYYGNRDYESGTIFGNYVAAMPNQQRFTGIYCTNGMMARGLHDALEEHGLRVPDDISIICSDIQEISCSLTKKLTTVEYPPYEMGMQAAKLFLDRLQDPEETPRHVSFLPRLIELKSVRHLDTNATADGINKNVFLPMEEY